MLDRAVLIHLELIDLPILPHEKCWVTVLYDLPIHAYRLNKIPPNRRGTRECSNLLTTQRDS
jgi:hypothetical protein